jgi:phosphohistidine swiveling domain-containing protein
MKVALNPANSIDGKWVYLFNEGDAKVRDLLGGKGAGLSEMTNAGLPVPPGFTITTEACRAYLAGGKKYPEGMWEQALEALHTVEAQTGKRLGDPANPLLVSVRSGAKFSMPGMMDTVLNLGLNPETLQGLVKLTGNERFAHDAYRRFIQLFGRIVMGVEAHHFDELLDGMKEQRGVKLDTDLTADDLRQLVEQFKEAVQREAGRPFPDDPHEQLRLAIEAVFNSWNSPRAFAYRNSQDIPHDLGTAVNVVMMVFGNMGNDSGTGVAFTRNPSTGEAKLYGEFLVNAQGEDVVAGIRTPQKIDQLEQEMPELYGDLQRLAASLEYYHRDIVDFDFTIENGRLWLLRSRVGKRTPEAHIRSAIDFYDAELISRKEAILRLEPRDLQVLLRPRSASDIQAKAIAFGLNASPGVAVGTAVFEAESAANLGRNGNKVILILEEMNPEDIEGVLQSEGVITLRGGVMSHAGVVCRQFGKPAVVGATNYGATVSIDDRGYSLHAADQVIIEGDEITIDGTSGYIYKNRVPLAAVSVADHPYLARYAELIYSTSSDDFVADHIGKFWALRDLLSNRLDSLATHPVEPHSEVVHAPLAPGVVTEYYISFTQPSDTLRNHILSTMQRPNPDDQLVLSGIFATLGRLLQNAVGIGNHHLAIRPLLDPEKASPSPTMGELLTGAGQSDHEQLVGIGFFGINRLIRNYLPWGYLQWWVVVRSGEYEKRWRLDRTNPHGESLLTGVTDIVSYAVVLNGETLDPAQMRAFYNELRKREISYDWYRTNNLSWYEVVDALKKHLAGKKADRHVLRHCQQQGLLDEQLRPLPGCRHLVYEQTAQQRRRLSFAEADVADG